MDVILISGKAQHGKDTLALAAKEYLEDKGKRVLILHYADYMKYIAKEYFGWNGKKDSVGRNLLQQLGTNLVRKVDENYWVDTVIRFITVFEDEWDCIIVPDTRFPNEIEQMKEAGFNVLSLRVKRPNFDSPLSEEQQKHPSETALDNYSFDCTIMNDSTISNLSKKIQFLLDKTIL